MWQSVKRAFSTWFWGERISKGKIRVIILDQIGLFVVSLSKSQETRACVCVCVFFRKGWVVIRLVFVLYRWKKLENRIAQNWVLAFRTQLLLIRVCDVILPAGPHLHANTRALIRNQPFGQIEQRIKAKALKSHLFRLWLGIYPKNWQQLRGNSTRGDEEDFPSFLASPPLLLLLIVNSTPWRPFSQVKFTMATIFYEDVPHHEKANMLFCVFITRKAWRCFIYLLQCLKEPPGGANGPLSPSLTSLLLPPRCFRFFWLLSAFIGIGEGIFVCLFVLFCLFVFRMNSRKLLGDFFPPMNTLFRKVQFPRIMANVLMS